MIGASLLGSFPISDFFGEVNFGSSVSTGGAIAGGTSTLVKDKGYDGVAGAIGGGAASLFYSISGAGGYPLYGDLMYGDMPYLERQSGGVGGAIGGGSSPLIRTMVYVTEGGSLEGGEFEYVRITHRDGEGGMIGGGFGDEDGDFSKIITCTFLFKYPEVIFVPPSERWDIPRLLKELE